MDMLAPFFFFFFFLPCLLVHENNVVQNVSTFTVQSFTEWQWRIGQRLCAWGKKWKRHPKLQKGGKEVEMTHLPSKTDTFNA